MFVGDCFSISDHLYLTCSSHIFKAEEIVNIVPNFSRADWVTIRLYLAAVDWIPLFQNCDTNNMCDILNSAIQYAVENFIPVSKISSRNVAKWENDAVWRLVAAKKRKWTTFKRNPTRRNKNSYNRYSKYVKRQINQIKGDYEKNKFHNRHASPKCFYSYVNNLTGNKKDSDVPQLKVNNVNFSSSFQKALSLSDQYRSIYTEDNGLLPWCEQKMPPESFCRFNITDQDIISAIN